MICSLSSSSAAVDRNRTESLLEASEHQVICRVVFPLSMARRNCWTSYRRICNKRHHAKDQEFPQICRQHCITTVEGGHSWWRSEEVKCHGPKWETWRKFPGWKFNRLSKRGFNKLHSWVATLFTRSIGNKVLLFFGPLLELITHDILKARSIHCSLSNETWSTNSRTSTIKIVLHYQHFPHK